LSGIWERLTGKKQPAPQPPATTSYNADTPSYVPKNSVWMWLQSDQKVSSNIEIGPLPTVLNPGDKTRFVFPDLRLPRDVNTLDGFWIWVTNIRDQASAKPAIGRLRVTVNGQPLSEHCVVVAKDETSSTFWDAQLTSDPRGQLLKYHGEEVIEIENTGDIRVPIGSIEFVIVIRPERTARMIGKS